MNGFELSNRLSYVMLAELIDELHVDVIRINNLIANERSSSWLEEFGNGSGDFVNLCTISAVHLSKAGIYHAHTIAANVALAAHGFGA